MLVSIALMMLASSCSREGSPRTPGVDGDWDMHARNLIIFGPELLRMMIILLPRQIKTYDAAFAHRRFGEILGTGGRVWRARMKHRSGPSFTNQ